VIVRGKHSISLGTIGGMSGAVVGAAFMGIFTVATMGATGTAAIGAGAAVMGGVNGLLAGYAGMTSGGGRGTKKSTLDEIDKIINCH